MFRWSIEELQLNLGKLLTKKVLNIILEMWTEPKFWDVSVLFDRVQKYFDGWRCT